MTPIHGIKIDDVKLRRQLEEMREHTARMDERIKAIIKAPQSERRAEER